MARLTDADLHRMLSAVVAACEPGGSNTFSVELLQALAALVPVDHQVAYWEYDLVRNRCRVQLESPPIGLAVGTAPALDALCELYPLRDTALSTSATPLALSDFLPGRALRRSPFYQEVLRPNGIEHELRLFLPSPPGWSSCFAFTRSGGRDFDVRDRYLLSILRPHLAVANRRTDQPALGALTPREREVLDLLADGLTNRQIAATLVVSAATVRTHLDHIFKKLGVHTRTAAAKATSPTLGSLASRPLPTAAKGDVAP